MEKEMENYQIIATESLGLAQRRLLPSIAKLAREMQVHFNDILGTLFNSVIETETEALLSQSIAEQDETIYTSVHIASTGALTLAIHQQALIQLTDIYFNEQPGTSLRVNNTALRLFDRLAQRVAQQISLMPPDQKSQVVPTKKLPTQAITLRFTITVAEQRITFDAILNKDFEYSLAQSYIPHPVISKESIEQSLMSVAVEGYVTLMSRSLKLGDVSSLCVGDIIPMEMSEQATFSVGDSILYSGKVSTHNKLLHFTVNSTVENNQ